LFANGNAQRRARFPSDSSLLTVAAMAALAASPFALLDAHSSPRLVTDAVHEDDALCLALSCRPLRDALWARFPARPAGHAHAGKRLRTRDAAVGRLGSRVTADGVLDLRYDHRDGLPKGIGRLAYLPQPGLKRLDLGGNGELIALPEGLCSLAGLEVLDLFGCGLAALPEGFGGLAGLKNLNLNGNEELTALPAGLWSLHGGTGEAQPEQLRADGASGGDRAAGRAENAQPLQ
jgi:Leucine-rich repeat (LRR) protein